MTPAAIYGLRTDRNVKMCSCDFLILFTMQGMNCTPPFKTFSEMAEQLGYEINMGEGPETILFTTIPKSSVRR